jgi:ABC-type multidrug transport system ATPase subunit
MEYNLYVKTVTHYFGDKTILADCSFECKTGQVLGVFGRNGSGKSTLFKILFGMLKPVDMELYLDNNRCKADYKLSKFIGYHPQEIMLPKELKVKDLITIYIQNGELQNKVYYSEGINDMLNKQVNELSLGQQRYLQFILLLNLNHHFLLLDEPFSMVEPLYKDLIKEKILEYKSHKGFIITDHYYLDVLAIADSVRLIKDGKMIAIENVNALKELGYLSERSVIIDS